MALLSCSVDMASKQKGIDNKVCAGGGQYFGVPSPSVPKAPAGPTTSKRRKKWDPEPGEGLGSSSAGAGQQSQIWWVARKVGLKEISKCSPVADDGDKKAESLWEGTWDDLTGKSMQS